MNSKRQRTAFAFLAATVGIGLAGCLGQAQSTPSVVVSPAEGIVGSPRVASNSGGGPTLDAPGIEGMTLPGMVAAIKDSKTDNERVAKIVGLLLEQGHYSRHALDDTMSSRFYERLLDSLDPRHVYFLKSDLDEFEKYRTTLDDLTKKGDISPAAIIFNRYKERLIAQTEYANKLLKTEKFTFTTDETIEIDREKSPAPANLEEAKKLWRSQLRFEYLQEKLNNQNPEEIVKTLTRRNTRVAKAVIERDDYDTIEWYINGLCRAYDPHTGYFGRVRTEDFNNEEMQLRLFGIGAQLISQDGYATIVELIPGGPAARGKELKPGDKITAVAQGDDGEFVDAVDMRLDKVVQMIRGGKGTVVRLRVIPANSPDPSARKIVRIVRDEVKLEEQAAKGRIYETMDGNGKVNRVGVVQLPGFYGGNDNGRTASGDVAQILKKFEEAKVSGVILDLRGNRGGLLVEAVNLAGLFLKEGPIVQSKDYAGRIQVTSDEDPTVQYDGPLVVLTDRMSASASEIVAGALQDYGRAVVVGDPSTFGKGTVQVILPLANVMRQQRLTTKEDPGSIHLTIQKFYRASGASTQLKGVNPDITVLSDYREIGEEFEKGPLPWDTVPAAPFQPTNRVTPYLGELKKRSSTRLAQDRDFQYQKGVVERAKATAEQKTVSLNEATRRAELETIKKRVEARKKELAKRGEPNEKIYVITLADSRKPGLPKAMTPKELAEANKRPVRPGDAPTTDIPEVEEVDITLIEGRRILQDYISLVAK